MEIRDSGLPPLSSTAIVTVDIEDVNDCPPLFSEPSYNTTVQVSTSDCSLRSLHFFPSTSNLNEASSGFFSFITKIIVESGYVIR